MYLKHLSVGLGTWCLAASGKGVAGEILALADSSCIVIGMSDLAPTSW